jgi:hypothetical protein
VPNDTIRPWRHLKEMYTMFLVKNT